MTDVPNVPTGFVVVRRALRREEGVVVQGLLESSGIRAALVAANDLSAYTRQPATIVDLAVPEDRAGEAEALLDG